MPSRRAVSASLPCVTARVSRMACRSRSASVGLCSPSGKNTTSPSSTEPCFSARARPPNVTSRSRRFSPRCVTPSPRASIARRARWFAYSIRPYVSNTTTPSLNVSITACPRGAKLEWGARPGFFSRAGIRWITLAPGQSSRRHHHSLDPPCVGRSHKETLAPPAPPPCPRQALPLAARQPAQLAAQLLERVRSHGLPLATDDGEAHRPIERGQVARLQPPRLTLLKAQPHHPHPLLHLVVHGHSVAIQVHG